MALSFHRRNKVKSHALRREQWIKQQSVIDRGHRIVAAAVREFAAKGVLGARVAEITWRANDGKARTIPRNNRSSARRHI